MAWMIEVRDETEELAARQAVETVRALRQAMKDAPAGPGAFDDGGDSQGQRNGSSAADA